MVRPARMLVAVCGLAAVVGLVASLAPAVIERGDGHLPGRLAYLVDGTLRVAGDGPGAVVEPFGLPVAVAEHDPRRLSLSPDGSRAAFACDVDSGRPSDDGLGLCTATGGDRAEVWAAAAAPIRYPTWSSDGARIAYAALGPSGHGSIWVSDGPARPAATLCEDWCPLFRYHDLAWAPDGRTIAAVADTPGDGGHPARVVLFDVASHDFRFLTGPATGQQFGPSWSPDSSQIAFSSNRDGPFALFVTDVIDGTTRRLTGESRPEMTPAWSPDGETIAYTARVGGGVQIRSAPAAGGPSTALTAVGAFDRPRFLRSEGPSEGG